MEMIDKVVGFDVIKAIAYECNYKDFSKAVYKDGRPIYDWSEALWSLLNAKNIYHREVLKLDVLQRGKDDTGFYQNYIYLLVPENSGILWDDYLISLGYVYSKDEIEVCRYYIDYQEGIEDYLLEVE